MARTRNSSAQYDVMLDKQGNPISPQAAFLQKTPNISGSTVLQGPGAEPVPVRGAIKKWRADPRSWARNMDAIELAHMWHVFLRKHGGFVIELEEADYMALPADARRHFMGVRDDD